MTLADLPDRTWDVVIVGAGPAGSAAATLLARQNRHVLLLDHAAFPREKPCGCCLGAGGVRLLQNLALVSPTSLASSVPLKQVRLSCHGRSFTCPIPPGIAITRTQFDIALIQSAQDAGVTFLDNTSVTLLPSEAQARPCVARQAGHQRMLSARLIVAADGIRGHLLDTEPGCGWTIATDSWMGVALTLPDVGIVPRQTICMHIAPGGYVGVVRLGNEQLHIAAALDPDAIRQVGGPARLVTRILQDASGQAPPSLESTRLSGTPLLTRNRPFIGAERILAVGDACGYVEPFTGQGMTFAFQSALALSRFLPPDLQPWPGSIPGAWTKVHHQALAPQQRLGLALRFVLHRRTIHRIAFDLARAFPAGVRWLTSHLDPHNEALA